jgi:hypothetical protein
LNHRFHDIPQKGKNFVYIRRKVEARQRQQALCETVLNSAIDIQDLQAAPILQVFENRHFGGDRQLITIVQIAAWLTSIQRPHV